MPEQEKVAEAYDGLRPREQSVDAILALVETFVTLLETNTLAGTLWIVDEHRFRIRR